MYINEASNSFVDWSLVTNYSHHKGGRIWVLWKPNVVQFTILAVSAQMIHGKCVILGSQKVFWVSVCYGFNDSKERMMLWQDLGRVVPHGPWIVLGDFNNILYGNERLGAPVHSFEMQAFQACVHSCGLRDIKHTGKFFTWNNKQDGNKRVWCKLDRALVNDDWCCEWPDSCADFQAEGLYDHSPCIVRMELMNTRRKQSFKFYNMWTRLNEFEEIVEQAWKLPVSGVAMYRVAVRIKHMKQVFRDLNKKHFSDVEQTSEVAMQWLYDLQKQLDNNPGDLRLREVEKEAILAVQENQERVRCFLAQKAKVEWLGDGDLNTAFFHNTIKMRRSGNRILKLQDMQGKICDTPDEIEGAFLQFYETLLGSSKTTTPVSDEIVRCGKLVTQEMKTSLLRPVQEEEVRKALFSIPENKAPGPDGYSSAFYKKAWHVVGSDICLAVKEFFRNGRLLKQVNATLVTLIPKNSNPQTVMEFRPIACCNVLYKIVSKVLCERLADILPDILSENQSAFTRGRSILGNILICQDLVRLYKRKTCSPRCLFKIDLKKAYDSVEWGFVKQLLQSLGFPSQFIEMIMSCVETPTYTFMVNGQQFGFMEGKRGLRQGDPLSPLLFTICMEYLSRTLKMIGQCNEFRFHPLCSDMKLNHLCFADDLVMFCKGKVESMNLLIRGFDIFSMASGLERNNSKSKMYVNGIKDNIVSEFRNRTGFALGSLPFRYLGVPVSPKRLSVLDCEGLTDKIVARIRGWGARKLSYMGRLTLVKAVLNTLHTYWAQIFILPVAVIKKVDSLCRSYLWAGHEHPSNSCPVAWEDVCIAKEAGGLGIIYNRSWNQAAIGKLAWWIHVKADHVWVRWVHHVYLKTKSWLEYKPSTNTSWCWRKICSVKERLKAGFVHQGWMKSGQPYSIKDVYHWLQGNHVKQGWAKVIWSRYNIPRHMMIGWLAARGRLATLDRLVRFGITKDKLCFLCHEEEEDVKHLFFGCCVSKLWQDQIRKFFGLDVLNLNEWTRVYHTRKGSRFQRQLLFAYIVGSVYYIWQCRNESRLYSRIARPEVMFRCLSNELRSRAYRIAINLNSSDREWMDKLYS